MTSASEIAWNDTILPFQLDLADVRGRVARLDKSLNAILGQHDYPAPVAALVAEAALLTALIGQTVKQRWKLSLQIRGSGPIRLIATDFFAPVAPGQPARLRAYAAFDEAALNDKAPFDQLGQGFFAMLIDQGKGSTPYQGITPLTGGSLADCAASYFAQSEQLPTQFALAVTSGPSWRAGGVMLQHLPKASPYAKDGPTGEAGLLTAADLLDGSDAENWNRATLLMNTAEADELTGPGVTPDALLVRLFHEEAPRVFEAQPLRFGCTCGPDKVVQTMSIYSAKDIAKMTTEAGEVTADCQFCGAHYTFDPATLGFEAKG